MALNRRGNASRYRPLFGAELTLAGLLLGSAEQILLEEWHNAAMDVSYQGAKTDALKCSI